MWHLPRSARVDISAEKNMLLLSPFCVTGSLLDFWATQHSYCGDGFIVFLFLFDHMVIEDFHCIGTGEDFFFFIFEIPKL